MSEKKRYLVTGGAGFIGSNFVKHLLAVYGPEVEITILDALTYAGNLLTLEKELQLPNVSFVKADIGDPEAVARVMEQFDPHYVVNFAAESHVDRSIENPRLFLETNILGTHNMLEQARRAWRLPDGSWRPGRKFLQIGTDEVYGSLPRDFAEGRPVELEPDLQKLVEGRSAAPVCFGTGFFTETTPLAPRSPYSASKTSADLIAQAYHETYGMPVNITRCSNNYGPYHFPEKLIPLLIKNILEGRKLPVYGRGENVRDWLYVDDHAAAIDLVLRRGRIGEVYNIGGFNEATNLQIVTTVIATMRRLLEKNPEWRALSALRPEQITEDLIEFVADRPGHDMRYAIHPGKIARELGWTPRTPFTEGIEKTVRWYLENPGWAKSVTSGDYQNYYERMYGNRAAATSQPSAPSKP